MDYFVLNDEIHEKDGRRTHELTQKGLLSCSEYKMLRKDLVLAEQFGKMRDLIYMQDRNGDNLRSYIEPFSLYEKSIELSISYSDILRESNRLAFNFASSLKTAVEISESFFFQKDERLEVYKRCQSYLFDNVPGYRFWIRLRNYLVHHRQLYTGFVIGDLRAIVTCSASTLCEWHGWNKMLRHDISSMDGTNCFLTIYPAMLSFYYLASEWVFLHQDELAALDERMLQLLDRFDISGEMYLSANKTDLYYVPIHELRNMDNFLEWRAMFYEQDGFARLRSEYVPSELKEIIRNPSFRTEDLL